MTTNPPKLIPPELEPLRKELEVFYRELPRLLQEGGHGKYVVIKGETIHWVWDTSNDAHQFALDKFGPTERFLMQKIDARFLPVMETIFGPYPEADEEGA